MQFDKDVCQEYEKQWVDTNGILQQEDILIVSVRAEANRYIKAQHTVTVHVVLSTPLNVWDIRAAPHSDTAGLL